MTTSQLDLVVRGGSVVTPDGIERVDLGVSAGRIARIAPGISEAAFATLDATDR